MNIKKLLDLFETHGACPGFELTAEGFDIKQLLADGLVMPGSGRYLSGLYVAGPALLSQMTY